MHGGILKKSPIALSTVCRGDLLLEACLIADWLRAGELAETYEKREKHPSHSTIIEVGTGRLYHCLCHVFQNRT